MPDAKKTLPRGYLLDTYRIEETIGAGGFSLVYVAYHVRTRAKVVIKEYFPENLVNRLPGGKVVPRDDKIAHFKQGLIMFFNEGSALAKLKHPNIVNVSNFFRGNNSVYMVMDYDEGRDLRWFIQRSGGRLGTRFMFAVFPQVLSGLRELHRHDFLHLDIKPANILLRTGGRPLLLDFGAAQRIQPGARFHGVRTLTRGFAPIEQYRDGDIGPWTDIYAMGATMYSCITGKPPQAAHERRERDRIEHLAATQGRRYPRGLLEAIDWSLELERKDRPQDADQLLSRMTDGAPSDWRDLAVDWEASTGR